MPEENGNPWNGEGLPPVGTTCEALSARTSTFRQCAVLAHRGGMAVVSFLDQEELQWATEFRSPKQIAADERRAEIKHIQAASVVNCGPYITENAAAAIYDAGYRKEVSP
ncbi:hypothetical protein HX815_11165 [Pseudomonas sp. E6002]|jgi:hypothetical protein|uniref:hypothetical protein n=1 Tax=unclassified Pseudomonas TaxID=196821 RepID=UPI0015A1B3C2|nr:MULTISPECIES: hypothetical protein [unclassified Pseudomonas]MBT1266428.1 hypothetical protein [Pseudomonas sp. VS38]NWB40869.1 hypothetical protein [Pseudomonas sp. E6002]